MGAVAIWCMHYIGNRAIQMLNGEPGLQIEYSARYTVGSFFLPICVVGLAFYYFNQSEMVSIFGTVIGGLIIGLAVCGMYYTGQVGILNYSITYSWKHILGSAIIAVVANTAALGIFFYFKMTWTASLIRKIGCAALLAMSVSGMHWLAIIGTFYQYKTQLGPPDGLSRKGVVIVVLCLVGVLNSNLQRLRIYPFMKGYRMLPLASSPRRVRGACKATLRRPSTTSGPSVCYL